MLNHILVPLDGSKLSEQALAYLDKILAPNGKLTLLTVIKGPVDFEDLSFDVALTVAIACAHDTEAGSSYEQLLSYLQGKATELRNKLFEVECVVETGATASLIQKIAHNRQVDAIVISTHGRTGLSRWLFGSVSQELISQTKCPVLLVPGYVSSS